MWMVLIAGIVSGMTPGYSPALFSVKKEWLGDNSVMVFREGKGLSNYYMGTFMAYWNIWAFM